MIFATGCIRLSTGGLFPDAELRKDIPEDFVGGDGVAGDGGEGGNGGTEVFREEVGGGAVMEAEADTGEGSGSLCEGLKMTEIGHEG